MKINSERLRKRMDAINSIAVTEENGMMRLALSDADKVARDYFVKWMEDEGLIVRIDDLGNIYGTYIGKNPDASPICIGSHMDTQANGGKYDGLYGVMAGLEAICSIKDAGLEPESSLTVINWTNEEGARFVPPMLASGVIAGQFAKEWVYQIEDRDGLRFEDELARIGYKGNINNRIKEAKAYLEPHIEQGPVLDSEGYEIGIVTGALGITGLDVKVLGEGNHAGTTPMKHRKDALMASAEAMLQIRENTLKFGEPAVITNGIISVERPSKNVIPSIVEFSVDMRYHTDEGLNLLEDQTCEIIKRVCKEYGVDVQIARYWKAAPVDFNPKIVECIKEKAMQLGYKSKEIISGAGHDAVFINSIFPTGMIFIPSVKGMSHCPEEESKWEDILHGTGLAAETLMALDKIEI